MMYMDVLLGLQNEIFSKMQIGAYKMDIIAAIDYLSQDNSKSKMIVYPVLGL